MLTLTFCLFKKDKLKDVGSQLEHVVCLQKHFTIISLQEVGAKGMTKMTKSSKVHLYQYHYVYFTLLPSLQIFLSEKDEC